jgi:hypothetical protein
MIGGGMAGQFLGEGGAVDTPEIDVEYVFIRVEAGKILHGLFARYEDGSLYIIPSLEEPGEMMVCRESDPDEWPTVLAELQNLGYVELSEAKRFGMVPPGWNVPAKPGEIGVSAVSG